MTGGADEAGRGPVFGPLVFAGVVGEEGELKAIRVRDSKKCSKSRRERLYGEITDRADVIEVIKIQPEEIDSMRASGKNLNAIECEAFSRIIKNLGCDLVYVDSLGQSFEKELKLTCPDVRIVAEFKADDRYAVVSAASIIAKVERDRDMDTIREELESRTGISVGSGYASDERTRAFLQSWFESSKSFPPHIRKSWLPARRYLDGRL